MALRLKSQRRDAVLDTPRRCCTMCLGRLLTFKGASRTTAASAPIRSNRLLCTHGVNSSVARLPL